jgi:hypothetical protein
MTRTQAISAALKRSANSRLATTSAHLKAPTEAAIVTTYQISSRSPIGTCTSGTNTKASAGG